MADRPQGQPGDGAPHLALGWAVGLSGLSALVSIVTGASLAVPLGFGAIALLILAGMRADRARGLPRSSVQMPDATVDPRILQILDALPSPTILVDRRGVVTHANHVALQAFPGFRTGFPFSTAIRAPDVLAALERVLNGEGQAEIGLTEYVPTERSFVLAIRRLTLPDETLRGRTRQAFAAIHMAETTQAKRVEAMRVDFVANASHELRTPLASILGFVETLQGPAKDDAKARSHFLEIMKTQAQRMARLIDDLLSLSRIEMHAHVRPAGTADLRSLLPQLVDALSGLARERGVEIRLDMPQHIQGRIPGDPDELMRALENLVENAIKYGQSGGFVDVSLAQDAARPGEVNPDDTPPDIRVSVRDYGPGIAAEHQPRLTERFYRADVQESRILGGTGLGLAIVKHIVMRHRGRLLIESAPGEGATFTIILPGA